MTRHHLMLNSQGLLARGLGSANDPAKIRMFCSRVACHRLSGAPVTAPDKTKPDYDASAGVNLVLLPCLCQHFHPSRMPSPICLEDNEVRWTSFECFHVAKPRVDID